MLVDGRGPARRRHVRRGQSFQAVPEDRVDMPVGASPDGQGPRTGGLQPGLAIAASEPQEAETGAVALLGCGRSARIAATSARVCAPIRPAQSVRRDGVHSRWC